MEQFYPQVAFVMGNHIAYESAGPLLRPASGRQIFLSGGPLVLGGFLVERFLQRIATMEVSVWTLRMMENCD
jgi:hypothetical protein